jgi:hypothetical protein
VRRSHSRGKHGEVLKKSLELAERGYAGTRPAVNLGDPKFTAAISTASGWQLVRPEWTGSARDCLSIDGGKNGPAVKER